MDSPQQMPGSHHAAVPFQVYLPSGITHWNSERGVSDSKRTKREEIHGACVSSDSSS